jgi:hypothetical protein
MGGTVIVKNMVTRMSLVSAAVVIALLVVGCTNTPAPPATTSAVTKTATPAASKPLTGEELRWLQAVEQLLLKMNKVFTAGGPIILTASALTSLANQVRGCSRELARIGSPSARLQPVHALIKQACLEYDKGAKCFEAGARLGIPSSSAATRELKQKIRCGYAASGKGGAPLAEAVNKAAEIKAATQ